MRMDLWDETIVLYATMLKYFNDFKQLFVIDIVH